MEIHELIFQEAQDHLTMMMLNNQTPSWATKWGFDRLTEMSDEELLDFMGYLSTEEFLESIGATDPITDFWNDMKQLASEVN